MQGDGRKEAPRNRLLLFNEQRSTLAPAQKGTRARRRCRKDDTQAVRERAAARTPIPSPIPAADVGNARAGRAHTPRATIPNTRLSLTILRRVRDSCVRDSCVRDSCVRDRGPSRRSENGRLLLTLCAGRVAVALEEWPAAGRVASGPLAPPLGFLARVWALRRLVARPPARRAPRRPALPRVTRSPPPRRRCWTRLPG